MPRDESAWESVSASCASFGLENGAFASTGSASFGTLGTVRHLSGCALLS